MRDHAGDSRPVPQGSRGGARRAVRRAGDCDRARSPLLVSPPVGGPPPSGSHPRYPDERRGGAAARQRSRRGLEGLAPETDGDLRGDPRRRNRNPADGLLQSAVPRGPHRSRRSAQRVWRPAIERVGREAGARQSGVGKARAGKRSRGRGRDRSDLLDDLRDSRQGCPGADPPRARDHSSARGSALSVARAPSRRDQPAGGAARDPRARRSDARSRRWDVGGPPPAHSRGVLRLSAGAPSPPRGGRDEAEEAHDRDHRPDPAERQGDPAVPTDRRAEAGAQGDRGRSAVRAADVPAPAGRRRGRARRSSR